MRGLFKTIFILIVTLVVFGLLANIAIDNHYTREWARNFINKELDQYTYLKVEYESASLSFMPLKLRLFGVVVHDVADLQKPLLKASQISVSVSFIDILLGEKRLDELAFVDLSTAWPPPKPLQSYLKNPPKPQPNKPNIDGIEWPPSPDKLPLFQLKLTNANIELSLKNDDPQAFAKEMYFGLGGIDLKLSMHSWTSVEASMMVRALNYADQSRHLFDNATLNARAVLSGDSFVVKDLALNSKRLNSNGDIRIKLLSKPKSLKAAPRPKGQDRAKEAIAIMKDLNRKVEQQKGPRVIYGYNLLSDMKLNGEASLLGVLLDIKDTYGLYSTNVKLKIDQVMHGNAIPNVQGEFNLKGDDLFLSGFGLLQSEVKGSFNKEMLVVRSLKVLDNQTQLAEGNGKIEFAGPVNYAFEIKSEKLALSELMYILKVDFNAIDFDLKTDSLKIFGKAKPFDLNVAGVGKLRRLDVPQLNLPAEQVARSPVCDLDFKMFLNDTKISFNGSSFSCVPTDVPNAVSSKMRFDGDILLKPKALTDLSFRSEDWNLNTLSFLVPNGSLGGRGPLNTRLTAGGGHLHVQSSFDMKPFRVNALHLGHLTGSVLVEDDILRWDRIDAIYSKGGKLSLAKGQLDFAKQMQFRTQITALDVGSEIFTEVTETGKTLPPSCQFSLNAASGFLQGPLKQVFLWQGDISTHISDFRCGKDKFFDSLKMVVVSDSKAIELSRIQINKDTLFLKGRGSISRDSDAKIFVRRNPKYQMLYDLGYSDKDQVNFIFDLGTGKLDSNLGLVGPVKAVTEKDLASIPIIGPQISAAGLAADLDAQVLLTGSLVEPLASFNGQLYNTSINGNYIEPFYVKGDLQDQKMNLSFRLGRDQLLGTMTMQTEGGLAYQLDVDAKHFDLRPLIGGFTYGDQDNKIWVDLNWKQRGLLQNWWNSNGVISLKQFGATLVQRAGGQNNQLKFGLAKPVNVEVHDGLWELQDNQALMIKGDLLEAQIKTNNNKPTESLNVSYNGTIDMRVLQLFTKELESASGKLEFAGSVTGKIGNVKLNGTIEDQRSNSFIASKWQPVSLGFASIRPKIDNIDLKVHFDQDYLYIDHFNSKKGIGEITGQGRLAINPKMSDSNAINLQLNHASVSFPVKVLKNIDAVLAGNLTISGNKRPYKISGKIDVVKARSYRNFDLNEEIVSLIQDKSFSLKTLQTEPLLNFDIDITSDRSIRIANKAIQALISTDLRLYGDDANPLLSGQVEIHRGKFYYKRDFVLEPSYITFDDPTQINPSLDISSIADAGTYRVYLDIGGRMRNPQIDLRTDPATHPDGGEVSRLDILVLLSTGRLPDRSRVVGDVQDVALAEGGSILTTLVSKRVQKLFDSSELGIVREPYPDFEVSDSGAGVVLRLNLPLVYKNVNAVMRINTAGEWEISSEYPLHDNVSLTGSMEGVTGQSASTDAAVREENTKNDAAVDLKFRFGFQ